jgi:hypothetical protein
MSTVTFRSFNPAAPPQPSQPSQPCRLRGRAYDPAAPPSLGKLPASLYWALRTVRQYWGAWRSRASGFTRSVDRRGLVHTYAAGPSVSCTHADACKQPTSPSVHTRQRTRQQQQQQQQHFPPCFSPATQQRNAVSYSKELAASDSHSPS